MGTTEDSEIHGKSKTCNGLFTHHKSAPNELVGVPFLPWSIHSPLL